MIKQRLLWLAASCLFTAVLLLAWQYAANHRLVSPVFMPAPSRTFDALVFNFARGDLAARVFLTLEHMLIGWLLASLIGILIGAAIGVSEKLRAYLTPTLEFFRPLPASAVFPVAISIIGLSEKMVIAVIAFGAVWPTLLSTINGFATIKPRLLEYSKLIGMRPWRFVTTVALPNAMPEIFAGIRLSLTIALILSVTGEILSGSPGLGHWTLLQARAFRTPDLFAGVMLFGLIGYASSQLVAIAETRLLRWRGDAFKVA